MVARGAAESVSGVATDARMWVTRRSQGKLIAAAMLGGEQLTVADAGLALTADGHQLAAAIVCEGKWLQAMG